MQRFLLIFLFLFQPLFALIVETAHFSEITPHIKPNTLVILDIDDTLLITKQMLGCDEWFIGRVKEKKENGMRGEEALAESINEWEAIRHLTQMEIVEEGSDRLIRNWQEQGVTIMGLTTQALSLSICTERQLQKNKIDLSLSAPSKEDLCFSNKGTTVLYKKGILFTSGTPKGEALFTLCEKIGYRPQRILFVNDKESHLRDIESVAEKRGVEFVGLRYGYSDSRKKAYSREIAAIEWEYSTFQKMISDEEAKKIGAEKKR